MSKISRYAGNLRAFASDAQGLERTLFGETTQADDLTSQVTASFLRGWGVVGPSENPSLEDFNAAMYAMSQFIAYQHQMGVPEWHSEQEYYAGAICSYNGDLYQSLIDSNVGNQPPATQWTLVITVKNGPAKLGLGTAATKNIGSGANQIPDMSFFASLFSESGYQKLPSGLIIQWGITGASNSSTGIAATTFPIAFPNACLIVSLTEMTGVTGSTPYTGVNAWGLNTTFSTTGFSAVCASRLSNAAAASENARFISIGY